VKVLIHSNGPHVPSGYGKQARHAGKILRDLGHEVAFSCFSGLGGQPIRWDGWTLLPSGMLEFGVDTIVPHALSMGADLVIPIMDFHKLAPASQQWKQALQMHPMKMAPFIISDCVAENGGPSMLDQQAMPLFGGHPVGVSRFGMDRLAALGYGTPEFPASYLPHCVDTEIYKPPEDKASLRTELGTPGDFVIGIMAANSDGIRKGFQIQFAAFQRFARKHKDATLAVFSVADSVNGLPLSQMAADMGIGKRVIFMPSYEQVAGMAPEEMVAAWYCSLDVLSVGSYGEGFCVPVIEAQACGTPVVATDCSALTELVRPAGWLVPGHRFWNVTHRAWWTEPFEDDLLKAWEKAYQEAGGMAADTRSSHAEGFAQGYGVKNVARAYWEPFMKEMAEGPEPTVVERDGLKWHYDDGFEFGDRLALDHEKGLDKVMFEGLPEDGTFVDVGAHVGHYALRAAGRCRHVIAVEANPGTAARLKQNIELNKITNISVHNFAAWDSEGYLTLSSQHGHNHDGTDNVMGKGLQGAKVSAARLDMLLLEERVDLIKIDCEGSDLHVLRGLKGVLAKHRPRLFIEDHSIYGEHYQKQDLGDTLTDLGYKWHDVAHGFTVAVPA
jgi:FkbM family methyltransferase